MSDNNYWEKRAVDLEKLSQDRADVDIMHVNKLFDGAVDIVEKQIEEIFGKYARDSGISQDAALRLLNEKQTETMRRNLMITLAQCQEEIARQAILARLNAPAYAARISRLEALKDLIHAQAYKVGSAAHYRLTDRLIDTYEQSYYRSIYDQQRRTETGFDFTKLADRDVQAAIATNWAGSNYSDRIWKNTKKLAQSLEEVITQGLMTGQSIRDMELALEARVVSERYKINRIIRTEVNHCCNQGTLMSYKAAGTRRYIFLATLDMRTSSICRSLDKDVFFVSKAEVGVNFPPMHPNCRSTTMAYPEDGIFPKERIARDPETNKNIHVPFDMSYAQWYRKYVLEKKDVDNTKNGDNIRDIMFKASKSDVNIIRDEKAVVDAYSQLPDKVQKAMADVTFNMGQNGSSCDVKKGIINIAKGAEKEDIDHEFGHLIEERMMDPKIVEKYKKYLTEGLSDADITSEIYENDSGEKFNIYILHGDKFISEYQGRLYIDSVTEAITPDGNLNTEFMWEAISELFRVYQKDKTMLNEYEIKLIEEALR
ncbi:MAG: minor capsid protein [Coprococcus sp.]|nr:MAG TPA: minor capsid protein [Caudoviricetes sp.]